MKRIRVEIRNGTEGLHFALLTNDGDCVAVSRTFRNMAWLRIGIRHLMENANNVPILSECDSRIMKAGAHFLILCNAENIYRFQLITVAGRALLTSREYENDDIMLRDIRQIQNMSINFKSHYRVLPLEGIAR